MTYLETIPSEWYLILSAIVFCIGLCGVLIRRNAMSVLMCIEMMLNAVMLLLVAFSGYYRDFSAQIAVFFIMIVAAAEVAVGLVIFSMMFKKTSSIDLDDWGHLKG